MLYEGIGAFALRTGKLRWKIGGADLLVGGAWVYPCVDYVKRSWIETKAFGSVDGAVTPMCKRGSEKHVCRSIISIVICAQDG